jgi:hypothetical protein
MDSSSFCRDLCEARIVTFSLDLGQKRISISLERNDAGVSRLFAIEARGLRALEYSDPDAAHWDHVELTELTLQQLVAPDEGWHLSANLWDVADLSIECDSLWVDGVLIRNTGDCHHGAP